MNENDIDDVVHYIEGEMDEHERQVFEVRLKADLELQELIKEYNDIQVSLKMKLEPDISDLAFKETLGQLNKSYFAQKAKIVPMYWNIKWASGIAAVLFIGMFIWSPWKGNIYADYAISQHMSVAERGDGNEANLSKAATLYNAHDYTKAKNELQKLYKADPSNSMVGYYYAITLIETGKLNEARVLLNHIYKGHSVFKYDAAYYMALSYIKEKNNDEARRWLLNVPVNTENYQKSRELIKELD